MADLTALSDVALWLEQQDGQGALISDTDGTLIGELITAVSVGMEGDAGRQFGLQTYTETYDGRGGTQLPLRNRPIVAVTSVAIDGVTLPRLSSAHAGYYFDTTRLLLTGYRFAPGAANVLVVYEAGFATIPADLRLAATQIAGTWYRERSHVGMSSQTLQQQVTAFINQDMPPNARRVLDRYKRVVPT